MNSITTKRASEKHNGFFAFSSERKEQGFLTKISVLAGIIATIAFAVGVFVLFSPASEKLSIATDTLTAFAFGTSGDGGCCGGGSSGGGGTNTTTNSGNPPAPSVKDAVCKYLKATPQNLPAGGGNVKLLWDSKIAKSVKITGVGSVTPNKAGSKVVHVTKTTTFVLTAVPYGTGGTAKSDTCKVTVTVAKPKVATCDAFTATPTTLPNGGGSVKLAWKTTNATAVSISGLGAVAVDGSKNVSVNKDTTFTLTAKGTGGNDTCKVNVKVAPPVVKNPSCDFFTVSPSHLSNGGGTVDLDWGTTNATDVSINQGVGSVSADGSTTADVDHTTTFTLTAKNGGKTVTCSDTVVVDNTHSDLSCDLFDSNKSTVEDGEDFKLYWETTGATDVSINQGIGDVSNDGSETTSISHDTTFTLTARNDTDSVTCKTTVNVEDTSTSLRCSLDISDSRIEEGDKVKLEWDNRDAEDIILKDDHGHTLVDTKDGDHYDADSDDITVKPTKDTEYTLTVYDKNGKKKTCNTDVQVDDNNVSVSRIKVQEPLVGVIQLAQVPYTGFDAGPTLTAIFYTLLALWGIAVAYILVVKKGSVFGFALSGNNGKAATYETTPFANVATEPVMPASFSRETLVVPANLPTVSDAPVVGYTSLQNEEDVETEVNPHADDEIVALEERAHSARALISTDALNFIAAQNGSLTDKLVMLDTVVAKAKAEHPTEDGWIVINKEILLQLLG